MSLPARGSGRAQAALMEITDKFCQKYQANSTANTELWRRPADLALNKALLLVV